MASSKLQLFPLPQDSSKPSPPPRRSSKSARFAVPDLTTSPPHKNAATGHRPLRDPNPAGQSNPQTGVRPSSSSSDTTSPSVTPKSPSPPVRARHTAPQSRTDNPSRRPTHPGYFTHTHRDSLLSIKDDPFFKNYQTPQSVDIARQLRSASYDRSNRWDESFLNDSHSDSGPDESFAATMASQSPTTANASSMTSHINIAVIGAAGVGKSTLIQRALGLRILPSSPVSRMKMSVDDVVYTVSLIELDLESFDISADRRIEWPKQMNGHIMPLMDGALILYDVMNGASIADLPQTLNALVNSSLPSILVACKCDNPTHTRQIDTDNIEAACLTSVESVKTASNVPESARLCLSTMLRAVLHKRSFDTPEVASHHRRAASSANFDHHHIIAERRSSRPLSQHSRASSEGQPTGSRQPPARRTNLHQYPSPSPSRQLAPTPTSGGPPVLRNNISDRPSDRSAIDASSTLSSSLVSGAIKAVDAYDMEESDTDSGHRNSDDVPILLRNDDGFAGKSNKLVGVTFDELVDRLLSQQMSRADANFSDIFLCLYRKFAAPGELLAAITTRLEQVGNDSNTHYLTRTSTQLRIITVIVKWVSTYPGDFASPQTSKNLDLLITRLASDPVFATAAQEMRLQLQLNVMEDDDTGWARTDADVEAEAEVVEPRPSSGQPSSNQAAQDLSKNMGNLHVDDDESERKSGRPSAATSGSSIAAYASQSFESHYHTVEDYEREAATLVPSSTLPLTKFRYHIFMDTSDDDFAEEMTRIDWIMFSSIRLRDLVRHVSLSLDQRSKCRSLDNVNRMINHFNHIARWVSNMILMRDKAKHRAQMLEKFVRIGYKLRQLNNYNGLAAIIAGINGSAIHRLSQTHALVAPEVQKQFQKLQLLMSTQKSHFAYRLAWENSPLPRIPFVPLHRRDLVSAEEGGRTFVGPNGDRINWKKFEVLAEVILPIMKSQLVPYSTLLRHDIARELILDCRMPVDDEEIYSRSLQVESSSGGQELGKKKFPWFQK